MKLSNADLKLPSALQGMKGGSDPTVTQLEDGRVQLAFTDAHGHAGPRVLGFFQENIQDIQVGEQSSYPVVILGAAQIAQLQSLA